MPAAARELITRHEDVMPATPGCDDAGPGAHHLSRMQGRYALAVWRGRRILCYGLAQETSMSTTAGLTGQPFQGPQAMPHPAPAVSGALDALGALAVAA